MTAAPPARGAWLRPAARGAALALGVGLLVALAGQVAALVLFVAQGANGSYAPYVRLGAAYVELFHRVPVSLITQAPAGAFGARISIAMLLVTFGAIAALGLVGRRIVGTGTSGLESLLAVVLAASGYAVVPFAMAFAASGRARLPGDVTLASSVAIDVAPAAAFLVPFAIAAGALAFGALSRPASEAPGDVFLADVLAGGLRAAALLLVLAVVGVVVLASVEPVVARTYGAVIAAPDSPKGRAVIAGHVALLLPNQAVWVAVPAMGACDELVLDGHASPFLCYGRRPTELPLLPGSEGAIPVDPGFRPLPPAYLAFLAIPLAATVAGGVRSGRRATSSGRRAVAGATGGVVFAALVAVAVVLSRIHVSVAGGFLGPSAFDVAVGPELMRGTAFAAVWGIVGGAAGGLIGGRSGQPDGTGVVET
jgi:hypothetical protein